MTHISKDALVFMEQARNAFETNKRLETYQDTSDGSSPYIALRMGMDRDCIEIYELGPYIANFTDQVTPQTYEEKLIKDFAETMHRKIVENSHKPGWDLESHIYLINQLERHFVNLSRELNSKRVDKTEITKRCVNIANFAMMITDNYGEL